MGGSVSGSGETLNPAKMQPQTLAEREIGGAEPRTKRRLTIVTEIIAPYRVPEFNALAEHPDVSLHVIFLAETDPSMRQWRVYKDEIRFSYQVLPSFRCRFGRQTILVNRGLRRALRAAAPEAIIVGGYNYPASWQALLWAQKRRVPLILWSESNAADQRSRNRIIEYLKAKFLRACRGFAVPGISSQRYLQQLGVRQQPIFIARNAVDNDLFARLAKAARSDRARITAQYRLPERFFLYVGRLVSSKGIFELLEAYASLEASLRSEIGLVFVGDGAAEAQLRERGAAVSPGLVQCFGFIHREQLPEFYALAEAFIFPTHSDPWGLVVNEAMACGLPVIASEVAGCVADLVEDGWNGYVVPRGQPAALAAAMRKLVVDSEVTRRMASNSLERIRLYSPSAWAEGMAEITRLVPR